MRIRFVVPFVALVATAKIALADLPPPNQCPRDAKPGTPCKTDDGKDGTCEERTRSHYMPPHGDEEPKRVESKYMGCKESAPVADASTGGNVPATPAPTKRGCSAAGSGATSLVGIVAVVGFFISLRRKRPQ